MMFIVRIPYNFVSLLSTKIGPQNLSQKRRVPILVLKAYEMNELKIF